MKKTIWRTAALVLGLLIGAGAWAGLETVTHISDLNSSWPLGSDLASTSDDHIRNIKVALKTDFPNVNAAVTGTPTQLNNLTSNITFSGTTAIASAFAVNSTTVPTNGIYLGAANTLAFASNTTKWGSVNSTGNWVLVTPSSGTQLALNAVSGGTPLSYTDGTVSGNWSFSGATFQMGTSSNHPMTLYTNNATRITIAAGGALTVAAPASGDTVTATSVAGANAAKFVGVNTAGSSFGPYITAGTNSSDRSVLIQNAAANTSYFQVRGDGAIQGGGPVAAALVDMTPDTGTFTATMTGGTTSPTCTARWTRVGSLVMLELCSATATSNANTFTYTGLPAAVQPTVGQNVPMAIALDNGAAVPLITAQLAAGSGTITFFKAASSTGWTNVGGKGLSVVNTIYYLLN